MKQSIYLRRAKKVIVEQGNNVLDTVYLATALKNMESFGFTFSSALMERLQTLPKEEFVSFYQNLLRDVKGMVGSHITHKPMYVNFPSEVMEMSQVELYINAIIHYITLSLPKEEAQERFPLLDRVDLKVIDLGSEEDFQSRMTKLMAANTSISPTDKEDLQWFLAHEENVIAYLPSSFSHKENLSFVMGELLQLKKVSAEEVAPHFKTATDVLRLAVSLSKGDVSLAKSTPFRKFTKAERRFLLGLLENATNITEDMICHKKRWLRLGEILHPATYKKRFPKTYESFFVLRKSIPYETFGGKVETALVAKDVETAVTTLLSRPGELARRLDHLLRISQTPYSVVDAFSRVVDRISTPMLLELIAHFRHRHEEQDVRVFFPKGNVSKAFGLENNLPLLAQSICHAVMSLCQEALVKRFKELPSLGNVYIDEKLKGIHVPFSQRSASKALRTITRGSQFDMPKGDTIRFFLWWKEGKINGVHTGDVDIDLSAISYDEEWNYKDEIDYSYLTSMLFNGCHSGDIVTAPNGAAEFIDIDIPSAVENGVRYVVMSFHSYSGHPFKDLPECFGGWMMRQEPDSGEVFEPATVQDKVDISSDTEICIPVIFDLKERKVIWSDLSLSHNPNYQNNVQGNLNGLMLMGKAMTSLHKPNLYELFELHATARGTTVTEKEEADVIFSLEEGITPFDIETIMADFLS